MRSRSKMTFGSFQNYFRDFHPITSYFPPTPAEAFPKHFPNRSPRDGSGKGSSFGLSTAAASIKRTPDANPFPPGGIARDSTDPPPETERAYLYRNVYTRSPMLQPGSVGKRIVKYRYVDQNRSRQIMGLRKSAGGEGWLSANWSRTKRNAEPRVSSARRGRGAETDRSKSHTFMRYIRSGCSLRLLPRPG